MLAGERAAELEDEIGAVIGDGFELPDAGLGLEVDDRPHVQAPDRRVRVDAGLGAALANVLQEPIDVGGEPLGRHRGVFDERQRLGVALHRHRQAERSLA